VKQQAEIIINLDESVGNFEQESRPCVTVHCSCANGLGFCISICVRKVKVWVHAMATKWFRLSGQGGAASATQLRRALGFSSSSAVADSALAASATSVAKPEKVGKKMGTFSIGLDSTMCGNLWFGFLATGSS